MRSIPAFLVLLTAVQVAACGGSDSTTDFADLARDVVADVPLNQDDLPNGWEQPEADEELTAGLDLSPECDLTDPGVVFPGAEATAGLGPFSGLTGQQVTSYGAVYETEAGAEQEVDATVDLLDQCGDEYKDEVERLAKARLAVIGIDLGIFADIDVSLEEADAELMGDQSRAYRLQVKVGIPGADQKFTLDVSVLRVGRVVGAILYASFGDVNTEEESALADQLEANMTSANERLSESPEE